MNKKGEWYKDEKGNIYDDKGHRWYGYDIDSNDALAKEQGIVEGGLHGGEQRILRIFSLGKNPTFHGKPIEVYNHYKKWFQETLFRSGLTTDDNEPPRFQEQDQILNIILVCKPTVASRYIYEGMRGDVGVEGTVRGVGPIRAYKSENLEDSLRKGLQQKNG